MKKQIISLIAMIGLITAPALAGVWTAQPSSGDSGKGCYLVNFNSVYGNNQLIGTGVVSGSTFSGFLKYTANPQYSGTTRLVECWADGTCAWGYAAGHYGYGGDGRNYPDCAYVISVSGLPINSATPIACY